MRRLPAPFAPRALRAVALTVAFFGLAVGCGHETFDLLTPNDSGSAGMLASAGRGGGGGSTELGGGANEAGEAGVAGSSGANAGRGGNSGNSGTGPCVPGQSCGEGGATCPPTVFSCKRCASSKECTEGDSPFCDQAVGRCTQCRPGANDCGPFEVCNPLTRRCATGCEDFEDCAFDHDSPLCDKAVGACVSCSMDSHCGGYRRTCYLGMCVECDGTSADQCPLERPYCVALRCQKKP